MKKNRFAFKYPDYINFEKTIGPVEEKVIRADFQVMINGNSNFENRNSLELNSAYWIFRHGWICARMCIGKSS